MNIEDIPPAARTALMASLYDEWVHVLPGVFEQCGMSVEEFAARETRAQELARQMNVLKAAGNQSESANEP